MSQDNPGPEDRASANPRPDNWVEPRLALSHTEKLGQEFAANALSFHADISEFQPYYNSSYPYNGISFRVFNGNRVDYKAVGNWAAIQQDIASGKIKYVFPYVVFMPGKLGATIAGLQAVFGASPPPTIKIAPMNDMESGAGFAGPGNHSAEANQWMLSITNWLNNAKKKLGYANAGDWASCWPQFPGDMFRVCAAYNAKDPGLYCWQYAGGNQNYPIPAGYPRSVSPFGTYVDINVIKRTPDQIAADFGMADLPQDQGEIDMFLIADPIAGEAQGVYITDGATTLKWVPDLTSLGVLQAWLPQKSFNKIQLDTLVQNVINPERSNRGWSPLVFKDNLWQAAALPIPTPAPPVPTNAALTVLPGSTPATLSVGGESMPATLAWPAKTP